MRLLGVDFGFRRIGTAVSDEDPFMPTPRTTIEASGTLARDAVALAELAKREGAELVIVGLPIEESGEEGKMAKIVRKLGQQIEGQGLPVRYVDERYTSVRAEDTMRGAGLTGSQRRKHKDGEAACLILEAYFHG